MTNAKKGQHSKLLLLIAALGFIIFCAVVLTACGKKDPKYTVPEGLTATYGETLEDVVLPEGFSWEDPITTSVGEVGDNTFKVTFTPEDTDNYNTVTGIDVTITVTPADLVAPTGLTATYGQTLADISLPENWIWAVETTTSVGNVGEQVFTVNYIGEDAENYANTTNVQITITVTKASNELTGTVSITGWTYGEEANTPSGVEATFGDVVYKYSTSEDGQYSEVVPTDAGTYYVKAVVVGTVNYDGAESEAVEFTIAKADLVAPTGLTATYGQTLADVEVPENWTWTAEETSVGNVGENTFTIKYAGEDAANYNQVEFEVKVAVTKASNEVTGTVSITGWTYGEEANTPSGVEATFGDVVYKYSTSEDGQYSEVVPTDAGTYYVKAVVEGTVNYDGAESEAVEFTIAKADPEYTAPTFEETYDVHTTLSELTFEDERFSWKEPATVVAFGENSYTAVYTPEDTANYNTVEVQIAVTGGYVMPEVEADLGEAAFTIDNATISNTMGNDVTPSITVGKLTVDEDYAVIWQYYNESKSAWENVSYHVGFAAGEYKAIIKGLNNYDGQQKEALFTVTKSEFNGTIEIQSVDFSVYEGGTVADITVKELENFFGTLTWDTEDPDYATPFEIGENVRYADITGGRNYNAKEHVAVTIVVAKTIKNFTEFKTAISEGTTELYITGTTVVNEDITVPKGVSIRVKKGVNFTVNGGTLTMEGFSIVNEGKVNTRATNSLLKGDFVILANTANNVVSAVNSGFVSKIVLNNDINFIENQVWKFTSARTLEIDLNGHNINGSIAITTNDNDAEDPHAAVADKIDITITNSQEEGGKITGKMIGNVNYALFVEGNAEALTVKLNNVIVESAGFALSTNGQYAGATIVATDSTFTSTLNNKVAVYLPADYTVTFTNCQISGATGIYVRNGNVTISNSTVTATGEYVEPVFTQGSAQSIGSAIIVDSAYGYADEITVTITGTTINSTNGYGIHEIATAPEGQEAKDVAIVTQSENTIEATKGETIILQ